MRTRLVHFFRSSGVIFVLDWFLLTFSLAVLALVIVITLTGRLSSGHAQTAAPTITESARNGDNGG